MLPQFSNLIQLILKFPDELTCQQYVAAQRWEGYMTCPFKYCDGDEAYVFSNGITYKCKTCLRKYTAKTGSIFEGSKIELQKWFIAIYQVMNKKGISSIQLAKDISVTQKTAWFMLQRIRKVFGNEKIAKLEGIVELDEAFVGGKNGNRHKDKKVKYEKGRGYPDKGTVFGMRERGGKVIATVIVKPSKRLIRQVVHTAVHHGTTLMTDGWKGYKDLKRDYHTQECDHSKGIYKRGECWTNGMENFWSTMKRCIKGTYIQVSRKHLNKYVQESVFRFNYRGLSVQEQLNVFISNMACRLKYKDLIAA